jgi:hypothetical protein
VNPLSFLSSLLFGSPPDLLGLYTGAARDYGDVVRFPGGPLTKSDHKRLAHQSCHPECDEGSLGEILRYAQNDMAAESDERVYECHMLRFSYFFNHPDHIKHVLQDNNHNYSKQHRVTDLPKPFVGEGLLTSDGEVWRRRRRLAQPAFHRQRLALLATLMTEATQEMLQRWEPG